MLIFTFGLIMIAIILINAFKKYKAKQLGLKTILYYLVSLLIYGLSIINVLALTLQSRIPLNIFNVMLDEKSLFNTIFWLMFIVIVFVNVFTFTTGINRDKIIFFIILAGLANGAMMLSPIFGYRSSLYTFYFLTIALLLIVNTIDIKTYILIPLGLIVAVLILNHANEYMYKYQLVARVHNFRLSQIEYYENNPNEAEAWLIRYPIFTIHSGDIEADDPYHMEVFKKYYNLNPDMNLIFYYPDEGYEEYLNINGW